MARGADRMGWEFAKSNGIPVHEFPADWGRYGKAAGPIRNRAMAEFSSGLLAFHDGVSPGTTNMIDTARALNMPVRVILY